MKKNSILLTATENLISTLCIVLYFNTLLKILLSLEYLKDCIYELS